MKRFLCLLLSLTLLCLCGCGGNKEAAAGDTVVPVAAEYADAAMEVDNAFVAESSEYTCYILFTARDRLTDVRVTTLEPNQVSYWAGDTLHTDDTMTVGETLLAGVVFYGDLTAYGISFADSNGAYRNYAVFMSGEDGSLILQEYVP